MTGAAAKRGMMDAYLFVYGTLLRAAERPIHGVLARNADFVGQGFFNGRLYRIGYYPGAVASRAAEDKVFGEIYKLRNHAEVLSILDDYEGCGPSAVRPTEFIRRLEFVTLANGTKMQAWIYVYDGRVDGLELIQSGSFLL
jgi:gamma-glutamylcyclotransferase (GGCT)/AIG2-like uncharacterized protein YtfP